MTIDLRSDTVTRPSDAMRRAIASAEVGDDVLDGDPTTVRLEERTAEVLGTERALFFPTGTMANQAAIWALSRPGSEMFVHEDSHIVNWEMAGIAALAGVQARMIRGAPRVTLDTFHAAVRDPSRDGPRATLLTVENTHAGGGGLVTPIAEWVALAAAGRAHGMRIHLDGARLWNLSEATGTPLRDWTAHADLTMVSYSKGLGAPVGSGLAGSAALIEEAWEARKRFGGGMRQSGVIAAGALYGLEHNMERLGEDRENARRFAEIVGQVRDVRVVPPDTNIVMIDLPARITAPGASAAAAALGVKVSAWTRSRIRAVTHLDATRDQVEKAARVVASVLAS